PPHVYTLSLHDALPIFQYDVYNIASSKVTPNRELVDAVKRVVPNFRVDLPPGHFPFPPLPLPDTKRLQADTGFSPKFDTASAVQDRKSTRLNSSHQIIS